MLTGRNAVLKPAVINAVFFALNRMTVLEYLQHAYDVINGNVARLMHCRDAALASAFHT